MPPHVTVKSLLRRYGREHVTRCMASWLRTTGYGPATAAETAVSVLHYWVKDDVNIISDHPFVTICAQRRNLPR